MATPVQAAATTVGAGSLAAAGAYGITQAVNGSGEESSTEEQESQTDNKIPTPVTFTKEDLTNYTNKFLSLTKEENLQFLVKPDNNEEWWKWAYENKYQTKKVDDQRHDLFNAVNSPETLKTACQQAYQKEKTDYSFEDNDYLLENISTFCTKGTEKQDVSEPKADLYKTAQKTEDYKNGVLSMASNVAILVKKEEGTNNDLWWKWAFKNLFQKVSEAKPEPFNGVNKAFSSSADSDGNKYLNNACNEAYKKNNSELTAETNKLLKNIKQFCSINRTETLLELPEPHNPTKLTTSSANYTSNKFVEKNTSKLIDPSNSQDWWEWSFKNNYLKEYKDKKDTLPEPFKKVETSYNASEQSDNNPTALNQACKKAYSKTKSQLEDNTGTPNILQAIKAFCVHTSETGNLSAPDSDS